MTACVARPETAMTASVETSVITAYAGSAGRSRPKDSKSPTPAGMNMMGMISMRNALVSRMDDYIAEFEAHGTDNISVEGME